MSKECQEAKSRERFSGYQIEFWLENTRVALGQERNTRQDSTGKVLAPQVWLSGVCNNFRVRVLVVDDEADQLQYLADMIASWGYEVSQAADGREALRIVSSSVIDVLVTDLMMPRMDGFELLKTLGAEDRQPPSIVMTAFGNIEKAIATIHDLGGFWFLEKPVDMGALKVLIERAGGQSRLARENAELKRQLALNGTLGSMIGRSAAMLSIFDLIRQVAPTKASVLITGESGTGKELAARALHDFSRRSQGPYVALNCAAMPETLMESELFGHERGAFTGAIERRIGALEAANGGTVFLDEIGEMPMPMQAKLLRVLEDFHFRRLGGRADLKADVRIVAATNRDPLKAIQEGKLREDLYYRLNVFHIELPPLRDRKDDIPLIVEAMIHSLNRKHETRITHASAEFLAALQQNEWEGNVRQLRNVVERAVIVAGTGMLRPSHVPYGIVPRPAGTTAAEPVPLVENEEGTIRLKLGASIDEAEQMLIEATLNTNDGDKKRTAAILGITTKTLHTKLAQYELARSKDPGDNRAVFQTA
jgi:DNA-binding NtrC family response regulator